MTWNLVNSGFLSGELNMRLDVALAEEALAIPQQPILRIYGWNPPAVSLGYHQSAEEFDLDRLRLSGIDLVRRPTGGRAILHWNEVTYCAIVPLEHHTLRSVYDELNRALLCGVRMLGIDAELAGVSSTTEQLYHADTSSACFSSSAKSEIQARGKKLVGSAQRRYGSIVLQHGSFLLGPEHLNITHYFSSRAEQSNAQMYSHLIEHSIDAKTLLGREVAFESAAECIIRGFEKSLNIHFIKRELLPVEELTPELTLI